MKWYHSIKIKLLGFFLFLCIAFILTLIITFSMLRESQFQENALKETSLATHKALSYIREKQIEAEVIASALSSIYEKDLYDTHTNKTLIPNILETSLSNHIHMQSAGIWFEPYSIYKEEKNHMLFFNRSQDNKFYSTDAYLPPNKMNYRDMTFYRLGKALKDNEIAWTNVYTDPVTKIRMLTVVSPIYRQNKFIGVASLDLAIGDKDKKFWSNLDKKDRYIFAVDKKGFYIGKSNLLEQYTKNSDNIYDIQASPVKHLIDTLKPTLERHDHKNEDAYEIPKDLFMIDNDPILHTNSIVVTYHLPSTHWHIIIGMKESNIMSDYNQTFQNILLLIIVLTLIATFLGYIILQIIFIKPITSINEQLEVNIRKDALQYKHLECEDNGEIGLLVKNLNARTNALEEAQKREAEEIEKNRKNEKLLLQQSKMAAMGEMMDAVAHQWKQPLNALSMYSELIKSDYEDGSVDQAYVDQFRDDIQTQIDHMVNTLDEFRTFFRPNKENQQFLLSDVVNSVLFLTKDDLLKNRITVTIEQEDPVAIEGSENEFKHLVLNIINNAKDAFNDNDIEKRVIGIRIIQDSKGNRLEIEDNAGGIPQEILEDIFKANVTSKEEGKGTGIGLYMSTQIAAKHHATLTVKNQNEGACFTVTFH